MVLIEVTFPGPDEPSYEYEGEFDTERKLFYFFRKDGKDEEGIISVVNTKEVIIKNMRR